MRIRRLLSSIRASLKMDFAKRNMDKKIYINEHARELGESGYTVIDNFMKPERCDEILKKIESILSTNDTNEKYIKTEQGTLIWNRGVNANVDTGMIEMYLIENEVNELLDFRNSSIVSEIINDVSQMPLKSQGVHCYYNKGVSNTRCYHAGSVYQNHFKVFVYLTDVNDISDGPYSYVKRSHKFSIIKYFNMFFNINDKIFKPTDQKFFNSEDVINFIAKKGTLIISDQNGFHRGLPQEADRKRALLVNNFGEDPVWGLYEEAK